METKEQIKIGKLQEPNGTIVIDNNKVGNFIVVAQAHNFGETAKVFIGHKNIKKLITILKKINQ